MKKFKILFIAACCAITCMSGSINANAKETQNFTYRESKSTDISPYYWPGNPNPIPGSEAWLQQNLYFVPTSSKARSCAVKVLGNKWNAVGGTIGLIIGKTLTLGGFANAFGVTYAISWLSCMY